MSEPPNKVAKTERPYLPIQFSPDEKPILFHHFAWIKHEALQVIVVTLESPHTLLESRFKNLDMSPSYDLVLTDPTSVFEYKVGYSPEGDCLQAVFIKKETAPFDAAAPFLEIGHSFEEFNDEFPPLSKRKSMGVREQKDEVMLMAEALAVKIPDVFDFLVYFRAGVLDEVSKKDQITRKPEGIQWTTTWKPQIVPKQKLEIGNTLLQVHKMGSDPTNREKPSILLGDFLYTRFIDFMKFLPRWKGKVVNRQKFIGDYDKAWKDAFGQDDNRHKALEKLTFEDDSTLIYVCTRGYASPFLKPVGEPRPNEYVLDLLELSQCEVQDEFLSYGASLALEFKENQWKLLSITYLDGTSVVKSVPSDLNWLQAKQRMFVSILVYLTLVHLVQLHLSSASSLAIAVLESLSSDHEIFQLLLPFIYRTSVVNNAALLLLIPSGGVLERITGFTPEGLTRAFSIVYSHSNTLQQIPLMDTGNNQSLLLSPIVKDFRMFQETLKNLVQQLVDKLYPVEIPVNDGQIRQFMTKLNSLLPRLGVVATKQSLVSSLCQMIFEVTACHSVFGNVMHIIRDPLFGSFSLPKGDTPLQRLPITQVSMATLYLGLFVSVPMPKFVADYSRSDGQTQTLNKFFQHWNQTWKDLETVQKGFYTQDPKRSDIDLSLMAISIAI